ncbi:MAG: hypothetical protein GWO02_12330, partial [Gammaproteobacteria bacterium]|nr:hypothetical protein [Gammaproteobacteria bacterium]
YGAFVVTLVGALGAAYFGAQGQAGSTHALAQLVKGFLPDLAYFLVDGAAAHPVVAGVLLAVLAAVGGLNLRLRGRIHGDARQAWEAALRAERAPAPASADSASPASGPASP